MLALETKQSGGKILPHLVLRGVGGVFPGEASRRRWRTLVSAVMNLRVSWNAGNFLTRCKPVSCSGRTLHRGVSMESYFSPPWLYSIILYSSNVRSNWTSPAFSSSTFQNIYRHLWSNFQRVHVSAPYDAVLQSQALTRRIYPYINTSYYFKIASEFSLGFARVRRRFLITCASPRNRRLSLILYASLDKITPCHGQ